MQFSQKFKTMIVSYNDEEWKGFSLPNNIDGETFKISSYGRVLRKFTETAENKPYSAKPVNGYEVVNFRIKNKKKVTRYLHKLVADLFLENPDNKSFVIHLDYNKKNNSINNLKWVNRSELTLHHFNNPEVIKGKQKRKENLPYSKLSEAKVRLLKRKIFDPNRRTRLKMIARQFGISEMQLYRIKTGENWGHITDF